MWQPTLDNHFFTDSPANLLARGVASRIPYILGCNSDEGGWTMQLQTPGFMDGLKKKQFYMLATGLLKWYNKVWRVLRKFQVTNVFAN